jgi:hypothetical protein
MRSGLLAAVTTVQLSFGGLNDSGSYVGSSTICLVPPNWKLHTTESTACNLLNKSNIQVDIDILPFLSNVSRDVPVPSPWSITWQMRG